MMQLMICKPNSTDGYPEMVSATISDIRAAAKEMGFAVVPLDHIDDVLEDMEIEGMHDKSFYKKLQAILVAAQED